MDSVCILIHVSMYLYSNPSTHSISRLAAGGTWDEFTVRTKMMIEWTQGYTPRPRSSEFGGALGGRDRVNSEMHLGAVMEQVWGCTWRPWWSEFGDKHVKAIIEWTYRCTPRLWSSEFGDILAAYDRPRMEVVDLETFDERRAGCLWDSLDWLVNSKLWECDNVTLTLQLIWRAGWWRSICREACQKLKLH